MSGKKPRALIAMSGGVDSSAAALLAMRMGFECTGVTMTLFGFNEGAERCAKTLGIEHQRVDFTDEFRACVIEPFVSSYEKGETPNPCVVCNKEIKFGILYDYAVSKGFDKLVTGHYARIEEGRLMRAADASKDQSYFLCGLTPEKLSRVLFPLGGLTKKEVRAIASEAGLPNADKSESQDICFIPEGGYAEFIEGWRGEAPAAGNFVDTSGRVLGRHGGIERYTIGQRKGLGIALGHPVFVMEIRPGTGEIVLADEEEVYSSRIKISEVNLLSEIKDRAQVMIRYKSKPIWATIKSIDGGNLTAEFDEPVRAPAKGQAAVFYEGDYVIGGGIIVSANSAKDSTKLR